MRTILIAALIFFSFSLAPAALAAGTTPNGKYCSSNDRCQSGYCSLDHTFFTFLNACATPPASSSGSTDSSSCLADPKDPNTCYNPDNGVICTCPKSTQSNQAAQTVTTKTLPGQPTGSPTTKILPSQPTGTNITLVNPLGSGATLESFLSSILKIVIRIGTIIVILMLVFVGYKFVVARGDPGELTKAKDNLLWTIVGALILLGAQAIAIGIEATVQALSVGK